MDKQQFKDRITALQIIDQLPHGLVRDTGINEFMDTMKDHCENCSMIFESVYIRGVSYSNIEESVSFCVTVVQCLPEGKTLLLNYNFDFGNEE